MYLYIRSSYGYTTLHAASFVIRQRSLRIQPLLCTLVRFHYPTRPKANDSSLRIPLSFYERKTIDGRVDKILAQTV